MKFICRSDIHIEAENVVNANEIALACMKAIKEAVILGQDKYDVDVLGYGVVPEKDLQVKK